MRKWLKISENPGIADVSGQPRYNGRRFDRVAGGFVDAKGETYPLRPQSVRVLKILVARSGETVSKDTLFTEVWSDTVVTDDSLTQCIADIRRALGDSERKVLETIPRQGFKLYADRTPPRVPLFGGVGMVMLGIGAATLMLAGSLWPGDEAVYEMPSLSIHAEEGSEALAAEIGAVLDKYGTVRRTTGEGRFELTLSKPSDARISAELTDTTTSIVLLSRTVPISNDPQSIALHASQLATNLASPDSGKIATTLFEIARHKPLQLLSPYECYLHYHQWFTEEMFRRAEACLTQLVEAEPENAKAAAFLSAIYVEQYYYGTGLDGHPRGDRRLRQHLRQRAMATVETAEAAGLPLDADVHLAVAKSYYANCERGKMSAAIQRAMDLNPHDPSIAGAAGNWLAYSGNWKEGVALADRAIAQAGENHKRWWHWARAKGAWISGDFDEALEAFLRGYIESDWHTHLHLVYTLSALGRMKEAQDEVMRLREVYPDFTREDARETHRRWCFSQTFIDRMDKALARAGLPERPNDNSHTAKR